ncbi:hypothetical protein DSO57_1032415 [Entomophthora muscae]|uniref:Uncharacterized protein n=1 Tax=Entomophthora muscae TaxID=34485 RepID=A0ACC2TY96_9FUNG|nr:hypothetical protein DSO57_1032415 [Entomophthora muscae]
MFKYLCLLLLAAESVFSQTCNTIVTRQEIRTLSPSQLTKYFNAINQLQASGSAYFQSCLTHYNNVAQAHGVPAFFPWHRRYIRNYEMALQAIDPSIIIPYWDWTIDSQAPENSPVLSSSYFGGNGRSSDNCVVQGTFAGWNSTIPTTHCLKRQYSSGNKISSFYSPEAIEAILSQSSTYDKVHTSIEGGPHGAVHNGIGGNNGDMAYMYSPNDPIFYAHHVFVDLLWNEWQMRNPSLANTYNGGSASSSDNMIPFNVPVSSVFNTKAPGFCYTYPRWNAVLPPVQSTPTQPITTQVSLTSQAPQPISSQSNSFPTFTTPSFSTPTFTFPTFSPGSFLTRRQNSALNGILSLLNSITANVKQLTKISPIDRTTRHKIRTPAPLPDAFIAMNNLDSAQVRGDEKILAQLVETLNSLPSFIPSADI